MGSGGGETISDFFRHQSVVRGGQEDNIYFAQGLYNGRLSGHEPGVVVLVLYSRPVQPACPALETTTGKGSCGFLWECDLQWSHSGWWASGQ